MNLILVLDLGTTNTKASLFSEGGGIAAEVSSPTPTLFDSEIMEIDQVRLWSEIKKLCSRIISSVGPGDTIAAITLSSMACTMIPLDSDGESLHNALSWLEKRPYEKYTRPFLDRFIGGYSIPNCGQYPLNMYPAFKIAWFRDTYPEKAKRVKKWVNISDYIHGKLLGKTDEYFCDYSIASRNMFFDDALKKWNEHALKEFSVDESMLPTALPTGTVLGQVGAELRSLGFDGRTVIALGGHDHICASVGAVIHTPDTVLHSTGTSEVLTTRFAGKDLTAPARCWLNIESSAYSKDNLIIAFCCASGQIFKSFADALACSDSAEGPLILNAYESLRKRPIFIPPIRAMQTTTTGGLIDIPGVFEKDDLWKSVYEGFALECKRVLNRIENVSGIQTQLVRSVGGQAKNDAVTQLRSNILNRRIERAVDPNSTARGAFVVAAVAIGLHKDVISTADAFYADLKKDIFYPEEKSASIYQEFYDEKYLKQFSRGIYSM